MKRATTGASIPAPVEDRSDWERVKAMREEDIVYDEDSPFTTAADWEGAVMKRGGVVIGTTPRRRGPGKKPPKVKVQLRIPPDLVSRWKATGPGWQTRMVEALQQAAPSEPTSNPPQAA